jgi:hypothetical protein
LNDVVQAASKYGGDFLVASHYFSAMWCNPMDNRSGLLRFDLRQTTEHPNWEASGKSFWITIHTECELPVRCSDVIWRNQNQWRNCGWLWHGRCSDGPTGTAEIRLRISKFPIGSFRWTSNEVGALSVPTILNR